MKKILILIIVLFAINICTNGQSKRAKQKNQNNFVLDSTWVNKVNDEISGSNDFILNLQKDNKSQFANIESKLEVLNTKQNKFELDESYFKTAISTQTKIFSAITSGFFILFGLLAYRGFLKEVSRIKEESDKELAKTKDEVENYKNEMKQSQDAFVKNLQNLELSLFQESGYLNFLISERHRGQPKEVVFLLRAFTQLIKGKDERLIKKNINTFSVALNKLLEEDNPAHKKEIEEEETQLKKYLDELSVSNDEDIKNFCALTRVSLLKYLDKINV